jgi:hypothetical protein
VHNSCKSLPVHRFWLKLSDFFCWISLDQLIYLLLVVGG